MTVSPAARRLWMVLILDAVVVPAILIFGLRTPLRETTLGPLQSFLALGQQTDSWRPMQAAAAYLDAPHDRPVYSQMLIDQGTKFQYPLSSLFFVGRASVRALAVISWLSVVALAGCVWWTLQKSSAGTWLAFSAHDLAAAVAVAGLVLGFYPVMKAYSLGQIQAWVNTLFAGVVLAWITGRQGWAGAGVGLMCLIKPTYALLGLWGLTRRRFRFVAALVVVVAMGTAAAVWRYGWADTIDYLNALAYMGRRGETFYPNQSFNGLLNRLLGNGDSLHFTRSAFAPFNPIVYGGTLAAFVVLMSLALWWPLKRGLGGSIWDLALVTTTLTATSPIAWDHHYGVLLPLFAATLPALAVGGWAGWLALGVFVVASQSLTVTNAWAGSGLGLAQSYLLAAVLGYLALLYRGPAASALQKT